MPVRAASRVDLVSQGHRDVVVRARPTAAARPRAEQHPALDAGATGGVDRDAEAEHDGVGKGGPAPEPPSPPPQNSPSTTGASTAVTRALRPSAMPAKVPATPSTVKARAVPMPWAARPAAKPRAA